MPRWLAFQLNSMGLAIVQGHLQKVSANVVSKNNANAMLKKCRQMNSLIGRGSMQCHAIEAQNCIKNIIVPCCNELLPWASWLNLYLLTTVCHPMNAKI